MPLVRRHHQLAWAVMLGFMAVGLVPILRAILLGHWVNVETPPQFSASYQVDINLADWPELAVLPGIGEVTAQRIVQYRKEHGPFRRVEDLLKVPGIGPKTLEGMRRFLYVGPPEATCQPSKE